MGREAMTTDRAKRYPLWFRILLFVWLAFLLGCVLHNWHACHHVYWCGL